MASGDEATNKSSDEKFDYECTPCREENTVREAKYFCPECSEYYCISCELSHRRLKATKNHTVLNEDELHKKEHRKQIVLPVMYCSCNQNCLLEFICEEHNEVFCSSCKGFAHRKCELSAIQEKSKSFTQKTLKSTSERVNTVKSKAEQFEKTQTKSVEEFQKLNNECRNKINAIGEQLHAFVDEITNNCRRDLESKVNSHSSELENCITTSNNMIQRLNNAIKLLQDARSVGETNQMFVSNMIIMKMCTDFENILQEIESDIHVKVISFQIDAAVLDILNRVKSVGTVNVYNENIAFIKTDIIAMDVIEDKLSSMMPSGAERITGATLMPNGYLFLCDTDAQTVKLFDANFKEISKLKLSEKPWNASSVSEKTAIVSFPYVNKLQFVETISTIKLKDSFTLDKQCFGVQTYGDEIIVTCSNDPGEGEVRILDFSGNLKRKLAVNHNEKAVLSSPLHLALNSRYDRIFISEYSNGTIYCMTTDGRIKFKCVIPDGKNLRGLITDREDNVFVCDVSKRCIYAITEGGTMHITFLQLPYSDAEPTGLIYRDKDNTLVVACEKRILVYKLK